MSVDQSASGPPPAPSPSPAETQSSGDAAVAESPVRQPPSDEQVLLDMAAGQELALMELHRRYARLLYGLGHRMLPDAELVHQGVQDTFVIAWNNAAYYDSTRASVRGWVVSIAHHRFMNLLRDMPAKSDLHEWFDRVEAPGNQNMQLLALAYYRGEPVSQLAQLSGLSRSGVEQALRVAADQLSRPLPPVSELPSATRWSTETLPAAVDPTSDMEEWETPRIVPPEDRP